MVRLFRPQIFIGNYAYPVTSSLCNIFSDLFWRQTERTNLGSERGGSADFTTSGPKVAVKIRISKPSSSATNLCNISLAFFREAERGGSSTHITLISLGSIFGAATQVSSYTIVTHRIGRCAVRTYACCRLGGGKLDLGGWSIICRDSSSRFFYFAWKFGSVGWGNSLNPIRIALGASAAIMRLKGLTRGYGIIVAADKGFDRI